MDRLSILGEFGGRTYLTQRFLLLTNNTHAYILYTLIGSTAFINFGLIPGGKLQLIFYIVIGILFLMFKGVCKNITFDKYDFLFLLIICTFFLSNFVNGVTLTNKNLTQPIYLLMYWLLFKFFIGFFLYRKINKNYVFEIFFKVNSLIIIISLISFIFSFWFPSIIRNIIAIFNNANTFDLGGIAIGFGDYIPRLTGFSPEPSFWSALIAINISVYLSWQKVKNRWDFIVLLANILSLLVTFGRTGYFIFAVTVTYFLLSKLNVFFRVVFLIFLTPVITYFVLYIYALLVDDLSAIQRFDSIFFAIEVWTNYPILGVGLGSFESISLAAKNDFRDVFSLYFNFLLSGGVIVLFLWLLFLASFIRKSNNYVLFAICSCWLVMPAYNLPFIWLLLAAIKLDKFTSIRKNHTSLIEV